MTIKEEELFIASQPLGPRSNFRAKREISKLDSYEIKVLPSVNKAGSYEDKAINKENL